MSAKFQNQEQASPSLATLEWLMTQVPGVSGTCPARILDAGDVHI